MLLIPVIAALATASGIILDKIVLTYHKVGHRQFLVIIFLFIFLISAFLYPFLGKIDPKALKLNYLVLLSLVIALASIYNVLFYHGIEKEKVSEFELIVMLTPLSTILIASIFLEGERNLHVFLAGIVASLALILSHLRKYHLTFDIFQIGLLVYLILYPLEAILIKHLLINKIYNPLSLYMVRTAGIFIILSFWFRPSFSKWRLRNYKWSLIISLLAILQLVLTYYAYIKFGVIFTTLVLTLAPILVYLFAILFLQEKLKKRIILAALIILACIFYANLAIGK